MYLSIYEIHSNLEVWKETQILHRGMIALFSHPVNLAVGLYVI